MIPIFDKSTTCCFSGYRPEKMPCNGDETSQEIEDIKSMLHEAILYAIEHGYTNFFCGMCKGFDIWAAEIILELKIKYDIKLICAIPFPGHEYSYKSPWKERYDYILSNSDYKAYANEKYSRDCFYIRNKFMVDYSNMIICYHDGQSGGTAHTLKYSKKNNLFVYNIASRQMII